MDVALVAAHGRVAAARATVRSAQATQDPSVCRVTVLAWCRCYRPVGDERVLAPADVGVTEAQLAAAAVTRVGPGTGGGNYGGRDLDSWLLARLARHLLDGAGEGEEGGAGRPLLCVRAGVEILTDLAPVVERLDGVFWAAVAQTGALDGAASVAEEPSGVYDSDFLILTRGETEVAQAWCRLTDRVAGRPAAVDVLAGLFPHATLRGTELVLSATSLAPDAAVTVGPEGVLLVEETPVPLLDLSAADPGQPWLLDAAAPGPVRLSDHEELAGRVAELLARRRDDGDPADSDHPAPFAQTSLGSAYDGVLRDLLVTAATQAAEGGEPAPPNPFVAEDGPRLRGWLSEQVPPGDPHGVPRYVAGIRASRPDLQRAFPRVPGPDGGRLRAWAARHGLTEPGVDETLMRDAVEAASAAAAVAPPRRSTRRRPGVNLVGYLTGELGIGESARLVRSALETVDVPLAVRGVSTDLASRQQTVASDVAQPLAYDTTLLCVNAAQTPSVVAQEGAALAGTRRIGYWYWEVETFPASQRAAFRHVDEVWVATDFVRDAVAAHSPVPVVTMTPPLHRVSQGPVAGRAELGLPQRRPVVLFVFDYLSTAERKNPWGAVAAFQLAFPRANRTPDSPVLVVKSINGDRRPQDAERLRLLAAHDPDVVLVEDYLTAAQLQGLLASCDVYLSLHRSEGLGLTLADAMSLGKPVVATAYSGNLQFMDADTAFLVPWAPVPIPEGCPPYPAGTTWADPDLEAAARFLRQAVDDPTAAAEMGRRAAASLERRHSARVTGDRMRARLEEGRWSPARRLRRQTGADLRQAALALRGRVRDRLGP